MNRLRIVALAAAAASSSSSSAAPASCFVVTTADRSPRFARTAAALYQEKTSWSEYKHDYVDPRVPHATIHDPDDVDEAAARRRKIADEFWMERVMDEKEKLHRMMETVAAAAGGASESDEDSRAPKETWDHYKHDFVEPLTYHSSPRGEATTGDEEDTDAARRRAIADKFWLEKFKDDKEKLHHLKA
uniref:Uncharacterized protein n=1 Tax=Odontella aurita TaxID=265563 RepID=A0A7S4JX13_9STRA|mmetsp:Transcript_56106/g.167922  ORF Transcript_56106/g.167922 Transcript_56106/m.167922 type:complete len:188 (+) Transcript_56106:232-795(+)